MIGPKLRGGGKHQPPAIEEQHKSAEKSIAKELKMCNSILSCTQTVGHYLLCCGCWLCKASLPAFSWGSWEFRITAVCCHLCWVHRQRVALAHSAAVRRDVLLPAKDGTQQPLGRVWWLWSLEYLPMAEGKVLAETVVQNPVRTQGPHW